MRATRTKPTNSKHSSPKFVREMYGNESYEYYSLGKYVVAAPGVCGGRPTFKHTRLEVSIILGLVASGVTVQEVIERYASSKLSSQAIKEAIKLASETLEASALALQPAS